jgi:hypothetical protein
MTQRIRSRRARGLLRASVLAAGMTVAPLAGAETGWVDDQVRLNLRTGPGNQYRILDSIETGDSVQILSRGDGWTQVNADGKTGWVPDGYLQAEPPAVVKLARIESESAELRTRSKQLGEDTAPREHEQLVTRESGATNRARAPHADNLSCAGARWLNGSPGRASRGRHGARRSPARQRRRQTRRIRLQRSDRSAGEEPAVDSSSIDPFATVPAPDHAGGGLHSLLPIAQSADHAPPSRSASHNGASEVVGDSSRS